MEINEKSLLEQLRSGDGEAFDALFDRLGERIYRFAVRYVGSEDDAKDVLAETFYEVLKNARKFSERSSLDTWVFRVAIHMCHRHLRRRRPTAELDETMVDQSSRQHADEIEVRQMISWLPTNLKAAFVLVKLEGLTYREAAEVLGKRPGTIQAQVHEASKRIRNRMFSGERFLNDNTECYSYEMP